MSSNFLRRAGKIAVVLSLALVTTLGATVVHAPSASAQSSGPAYFLWSSRTGEYGPCANRVGTYVGEWGIGTTGWDSIYVGHRWIGDYSFYDYRDRGFDTAYVYYGCYGSYPAYGYYGAHKISRGVHVQYYCPLDTCYYQGTQYDSWRSGW
jgi:hypothetical protein